MIPSNGLPVAHVDRGQLHAERRRHGLDGSKQASSASCGGIAKHSGARHAGRDLLEQFQPFPAQAEFEKHETGGVAARPRQAVNKAGSDRVDDTHEHDRYGAARPLQLCDGRRALARMTSGASVSTSVACRRMSSALPPAHRVSMRTFRPSVHPDFCNPSRNAVRRA